MSTIIISRDLRNRFGPARNQGSRSTCLAFAMSDAHAAVRAAAWELLSCEYLFFQAKRRDNVSHEAGTTLTAIRAALSEDGQPFETEWPYLSALPANLASWKPPASVGTLFRREADASGKAFDQVWTAVEEGKPVVLTMTLSGAFYTPDPAGVIDEVAIGGVVIRHAVVAVATGHRSGQRLLLVRNSWGESWGLAGYAWLSERYARHRISAAITLR